jgi:DNA-binding transcriptional MerR regulator
MPRKKLVKISELARMAGVTTPTIKHYMAEGLLPEPAMRTSRNMAYYEPALAERIRAIKALQQTHFPLKVIGELLEPAPSAKLRPNIEVETRRRLGLMMPGIEAEVLHSERRGLTRDEVLERLQVTAEDLEQLEGLRLALPRSVEGKDQPVYAGSDLDLLEVIDETRRKGLAQFFPMEIIPKYVGFLRRLVQDELELFKERVLDGELPEEISIEQVTREAARLGGRLVVAMRSRLILTELQALLANGGD